MAYTPTWIKNPKTGQRLKAFTESAYNMYTGAGFQDEGAPTAPVAPVAPTPSTPTAPTAPASATQPPASTPLPTYKPSAPYVHSGGYGDVIYKDDLKTVQTVGGIDFSRPEDLAKYLGIRPDQIDWNKIKKPDISGKTRLYKPDGTTTLADNKDVGFAISSGWSTTASAFTRSDTPAGFTPGMTMYSGNSTRTAPDRAAYDEAIREGFKPTAPTAPTPSSSTGYQPSLLDIFNSRPDVQADFARRFPGQNPTVQGTEANRDLNDWYNQVGKAEGADMVAKGLLKPPTGSSNAQEGETRTNPQTGQSETYTPDGTWQPINTPGDTGSDTGGSTGDIAGFTGGSAGEVPGGTTGTAGTDDIMTQFKTYMDTMNKNQTDSQAKIEELMTKMGEDTTNATLTKFQEMQKGLQDSFSTYFAEQTKYLDELKNQPSAVENLQKFREQQGLPQMEQMLAGVDRAILDTEGLLNNIEADVKKRTEGLPVSEAAMRRLIAMEGKPINKQLDEQLRSRQRVAAGLQAKQATVEDFMKAQTEDLDRSKEISEARLGISKERYGAEKDIATESFDMFTGLQDRLTKIDSLRIDQAISDKDYKNKLAEAGFDLFTQLRAEKLASKKENTSFKNELIKLQFENDLKKSNPDIKSVNSFTDASGSVTQVITYANGTSEMVNLGQIDAAKAGTDTNVVTDNERALMAQFRGEQIVKDYNNVLSQKSAIDNYINNGVGGPADLAMIFTFMKSLDPNSVVREAEYATAAKSGNIFSGWAAKYNGYLKEEGGILPDNVKREFQNLVNQKLNSQKVLYDNVAKNYRNIAERQGLNPENVVVDYAGANPSNVDDIWGDGGSGDMWDW